MTQKERLLKVEGSLLKKARRGFSFNDIIVSHWPAVYAGGLPILTYHDRGKMMTYSSDTQLSTTVVQTMYAVYHKISKAPYVMVNPNMLEFSAWIVGKVTTKQVYYYDAKYKQLKADRERLWD